MPNYTGQQLSTINLLASEIQPTLNQLHDFVFGFNDADIYIYEFVVSSFPTLAASDQRCFKPANKNLQADARYWKSEFFKLQQISSQSQGEISITDANKLINVTTKFSVWCDMVLGAYLTNDIPAYHNKIRYVSRIVDVTEALGFDSGVTYNEYKTDILEPTNTLNTSSELCEYFDGGALRVVQGFFKPQDYQNLVQEIKQKSETINNLLNAPEPDPVATIQPIQLNQTGTNKMLKTLGEIFSYIKDGFSSLNRDIGKITAATGSIENSLHDLRSVELKQARQIIQDLRGDAKSPTISTQSIKHAVDAQTSLFIIGSEGNYYPIEFNYFPGELDSQGLPVDPQTGKSLNIVRLSTTNGLIFSLRRADDNNQIRYLRINDVLYEINTGISTIKPEVETVKQKTIKNEAVLEQILNKLSILEVKINSISERI